MRQQQDLAGHSPSAVCHCAQLLLPTTHYPVQSNIHRDLTRVAAEAQVDLDSGHQQEQCNGHPQDPKGSQSAPGQETSIMLIRISLNSLPEDREAPKSQSTGQEASNVDDVSIYRPPCISHGILPPTPCKQCDRAFSAVTTPKKHKKPGRICWSRGFQSRRCQHLQLPTICLPRHRATNQHHARAPIWAADNAPISRSLAYHHLTKKELRFVLL